MNVSSIYQTKTHSIFPTKQDLKMLNDMRGAKNNTAVTQHALLKILPQSSWSCNTSQAIWTEQYSPALFNDQFSRERLPTTELIFVVGVAVKHLAVLEGKSGFAEEAKHNNALLLHG